MFRNSSHYLGGAAAVALSATALAACGSGGGAATAATPATSAAGHTATVRLANNSSLGKILVDSRGHTLYMFQKDTRKKSACFGACAANWPPLRSAKPVVAAGLSRAKVATIKRSDGKPQVTYNGHPLYRFAADTKPGQASGQGVNAFGGSWFAVSAAGTKASGSSSTTTGGGYGGSGY
jgi:predicted lipoprotein with Yx(FWY)xxD motif